MTEELTTKGRLIGKILIDWCSEKSELYDNIHFDKSLCSGLQNIRFTTDNLDTIFAQNISSEGYLICYELQNVKEQVQLVVAINKRFIGKRLQKTFSQLITSVGVPDSEVDELVLKKWDVSSEIKNISQIPEVLNQLFDYEMSYFETELFAWLTDHNRKIKSFPQYDLEVLSNTELPSEILIEGGMKDILTNRYERNRKARNRCIAHYGTACIICGFDFGAVYGERFSGKIHVHHRKPLNEIGEDYIVDPIKDLVPVCPNCHLVLHSKDEGAYTVEEVKNMMSFTDINE